MMYYKQSQDCTVKMLMELMTSEAEKNPHWKLQELLSLCRNMEFIVDDPMNADYSDITYLVLAELFCEIKESGSFSGTKNTLCNIESFTMDEDSKAEIISVLNDLMSQKLHDRTRMLIKQWEKEGTLHKWLSHAEQLKNEIMDEIPQSSYVGVDDAEAYIENNKKSKKRRKRKKKGFFFFLLLIFIWLSLYVVVNGAAAVCSVVNLKLNGVRAKAEVIQSACEIKPQSVPGIKPNSGFSYFEIVKFTDKSGREISSHLHAKNGGEESYNIGERLEIYYNPKAPAQICDADSDAQLIKGIFILLFGLLFFWLFSLLIKGYFSSMGTIGTVKSLFYKLALFVLALGFFVYQNIYPLYRYFPSSDEEEHINSEGIMLSKENMKPFSGRIKTCTDDSLSIYSYKDGLLDGLYVVYHNGAVKEAGHWIKGKQNGLFLLYTPTGILIDYGNFENGERHGITRQFDPEDGSLLVDASYNKGNLDGIYTQYYPGFGGTAAVLNYDNGILEGPAFQYYADGQIQIEMNYENGVPNGAYRSYYPNGQLQADGRLENGAFSSDTKLYSENGEPLGTALEQRNNSKSGIFEEEEEISIYELDEKA